MSRPSPLFHAKAGLARMIGRASRISGRGSGTTLPGRALLRMAPDALSQLSRRLDGPVTVVSATNGKTTTATLLSSVLESAGRRPVHNRAGSNMTWGVATALLTQRGSEGLFEVDEAWLPEVSERLRPSLYLLCNLFRDQLDRHGELETLAENWAAMLDARDDGPALVLNADDPMVADLGRDRDGELRPGVTYFGIDDASHALDDEGIAHDAKNCRRCGHPYEYDFTLLGHLGTYACPSCGAKRPLPQVRATEIRLNGMDGSCLTVESPAGATTIEVALPGLYNAYNALAAFAAALQLGVEPPVAAAAIGRTAAAFGRVETVRAGGKTLSILLIKNPTGATEVLRTLASAGPGRGIDLWVALNDGTADGRDISWIWDCDFERLATDVRQVTCSGSRANELALRLKYAGWPEQAITVNPDLEASLDASLADSEERLFALPTYTALLELRSLLARRGLVKEHLE